MSGERGEEKERGQRREERREERREGLEEVIAEGRCQQVRGEKAHKTAPDAKDRQRQGRRRLRLRRHLSLSPTHSSEFFGMPRISTSSPICSSPSP